MFNKKMKILTVLMVVLIATLSLFWHNSRQKIVTIQVDNKIINTKTTSNTIEELLNKQRIWLAPKDEVYPSGDQRIFDGMEIRVLRAFPVSIKVDGEVFWCAAVGGTVKEIIEREEIPFSGEDIIMPSLEEALIEDMEIQIVRVSSELITIKESMPFDIITRKNPKLEKGFTRTIAKGTPGTKEVIQRVIYHDGNEFSRAIEFEKVIKEPKHKIVEQGTLDTVVTSRGETLRFKSAFLMEATAYDACVKCTGKNPGDKYYGITRMGIPVRPGIIAVDPSVIPLGTRVYVEGYGLALAADTGSAIKGNRIDLYMETHQEALRFGRRKVKLYILE